MKSKEKEPIKKDYYKIANCIKSSKTELHFNTCKRLIELFIEKNTGRVELTFQCINRMNYVNKLSKELELFITQQKTRNLLLN